MLLALDYDGTYTADPALWEGFIRDARIAGHEVICVTMRYPSEPIEMSCETVYTSRQAKMSFMNSIGRLPDVWIDDKPHWIFQASA